MHNTNNPHHARSQRPRRRNVALDLAPGTLAQAQVALGLRSSSDVIEAALMTLIAARAGRQPDSPVFIDRCQPDCTEQARDALHAGYTIATQFHGRLRRFSPRRLQGARLLSKLEAGRILFTPDRPPAAATPPPRRGA